MEEFVVERLREIADGIEKQPVGDIDHSQYAEDLYSIAEILRSFVALEHHNQSRFVRE